MNIKALSLALLLVPMYVISSDADEAAVKAVEIKKDSKPSADEIKRNFSGYSDEVIDLIVKSFASGSLDMLQDHAELKQKLQAEYADIFSDKNSKQDDSDTTKQTRTISEDAVE